MWHYIPEVSQNTHIMTQKFQLGKHSIRKITNLEENKIMYEDDHLNKREMGKPSPMHVK